MLHARTILDRMIGQALMPLINIGISAAVATMLLDLACGFRPLREPVPVAAAERNSLDEESHPLPPLEPSQNDCHGERSQPQAGAVEPPLPYPLS